MDATLWVLVVAQLGAGRMEAADPRIERILKDWQRRQESVKCVQYVVKGEGVIPKGSRKDESTGAAYPDRDVSLPQEAIAILN
jgi:hypothetical protein